MQNNLEVVIFVYVKELCEKEAKADGALYEPSLSASVVSQQVSDYQCRISSPVPVSRLSHICRCFASNMLCLKQIADSLVNHRPCGSSSSVVMITSGQ